MDILLSLSLIYSHTNKHKHTYKSRTHRHILQNNNNASNFQWACYRCRRSLPHQDFRAARAQHQATNGCGDAHAPRQPGAQSCGTQINVQYLQIPSPWQYNYYKQQCQLSSSCSSRLEGRHRSVCYYSYRLLKTRTSYLSHTDGSTGEQEIHT